MFGRRAHQRHRQTPIADQRIRTKRAGSLPFTNRQFYQSLDDYLRLHPCQYPLIAAGDWNAVASNDGRIGEKVTTHLKDFLANWDLLDTYTLISKHRKGLYTHTNNSRGAGRRLDQLHISSTLSQWIKSTQLVTNKQGHNITKSSHHAVQFVFNFGNLTQRQDRGPGTWRMPWWVFDTEYIAWLKFHVKSILKRYGPLKPSLKLQCLKENIKVTIQQEAKTAHFEIPTTQTTDAARPSWQQPQTGKPTQLTSHTRCSMLGSNNPSNRWRSTPYGTTKAE